MSDMIPTGRTSEKWYGAGYQAAMADIARELREGGTDAVTEWLRNNHLQPAPAKDETERRRLAQNAADATGIAQFTN